ncbi:hypothetical protein [Paenibacillus sp. TC-CSREp1]|uniref:hypothetical protein n=1 Tax=Paenibacillus sp. TC-CSREp1 TaxID=3410089 RepID=UPI003CFC492F
MHVIDFQSADAKPVGERAAGRPVAPISHILESTALRINSHPVFLAAGSYVCATADLLDQAPLVWHEQAGGMYRWEQLHVVQVQDRMLEPSGLLLVQAQPHSGEQAGVISDEVNPARLRDHLLEFRIELCKAGLEYVRKHLSVRVSGGQSTFQHQLVKGMVADILTTFYMAETLHEDRLLSRSSDITSIRTHAWLHEEIDEAFRQIQRLGGGYGYLRHGVSAYTYAGQLVKNLLLPDREGY